MFLQKKLLEQNQIPDPFKSAAFEAENRDRDKDEVELVLECADEENASNEDSVDVRNDEGANIYENLSSDENTSDSDECVSYSNEDPPHESNENRKITTIQSSSEEEDANEDRGDTETEEMIESDSEEEIRGRGRVIYSSEDEEPIPTSKGLFDNFPEETREFIQDEMGRQHFTCPRSGEGHMFLASAQINPSTAQAHINDIVDIFTIRPELKKPILQLITDDGMGFSFF